MANDKKMVEAITSMDEDFAQWYTDVCPQGRAYRHIPSVKGCMAIQARRICHLGAYTECSLDQKIQGRQAWRMCTCQCLFQRAFLREEKDHVEGFAPEVAWVTYGGLNPLTGANVCKTYIRDTVL